ncbi:MAG: winged helix-turn-helix transcriptional regulator [Nitrospirota bacterium]|nr:winged helix-turn-helix transcriptional regulator [Nitrospirota bacterium]
MNKGAQTPSPSESGQYRSLQILDELANNDALTQRDLSQRLGIALGLVNSYIKNLVAKGFITVKNIPSKRYAYYLTPKGFAEKTRLAYDLLADYTRIYREAKQSFRLLFQNLEHQGIKKVVFAGADEVAEIAYITLQETDLELVGIVDTVTPGERLFSYEVLPIQRIRDLTYEQVIVTTYTNRMIIQEALHAQGLPEKAISRIFQDALSRHS